MMRFHKGAPPKNAEFVPAAEGYQPIKEPKPAWVQVIAIPIVIVVLVAFIAWMDAMGLLASDLDTLFRDMILTVVLFFPLLGIHELLHAVVHPLYGMSENTVIGWWPSKFLFYAHYDREMVRERFLICFLTPLLVLSVVPMLVMQLTGWTSPLVAFLATANAVGAAGDLIGFALIVVQVPMGAQVRNQGWRTYWRSM